MSENLCNNHGQEIAGLKAVSQMNEKRMDRLEQKIDNISTQLGDFKDEVSKQVSVIGKEVNTVAVRVGIAFGIVALIASPLVSLIINKIPLLLASIKQ